MVVAGCLRWSSLRIMISYLENFNDYYVLCTGLVIASWLPPILYHSVLCWCMVGGLLASLCLRYCLRLLHVAMIQVLVMDSVLFFLVLRVSEHLYFLFRCGFPLEAHDGQVLLLVACARMGCVARHWADATLSLPVFSSGFVLIFPSLGVLVFLPYDVFIISQHCRG